MTVVPSQGLFGIERGEEYRNNNKDVHTGISTYLGM